MSWFLAFAGFAALIILHEFGHFIAAKATGMRVERFFLFFPPKLVSVRRGETEYGIGAIPLGGFVKITGMNPDEVREPQPEEQRDEGEEEQNPAQSLIDRIEGPSEPMTPEVRARAYYNQPVWKRIVVIAAGPAMNLLIAFLLLFGLAFSAEEPVGPGLEIGAVSDGSPAEGKLQENDRIVSVDGVRASNLDWDERSDRLREQIDSHACAGEPTDGCVATTPARIVVERDGREVPVVVRPEYSADADRNLIGFGYGPADFEPIDPSPAGAAERSLDQMWFITRETASVFANIFSRGDELSGPVGSYEVTRQAFDFDTRVALTLLALISLSLAIINLFPFLPLDGGHIFWSLVEKVRGRPVPYSTMERGAAVGFVLVMMIFFLGLTNDIGRLTGEGFDIQSGR